MQTNYVGSASPSGILYSIICMKDLGHSINFYHLPLSMQELRSENFTMGRFTLVFLDYGDKQSWGRILQCGIYKAASF